MSKYDELLNYGDGKTVIENDTSMSIALFGYEDNENRCILGFKLVFETEGKTKTKKVLINAGQTKEDTIKGNFRNVLSFIQTNVKSYELLRASETLANLIYANVFCDDLSFEITRYFRNLEIVDYNTKWMWD